MAARTKAKPAKKTTVAPAKKAAVTTAKKATVTAAKKSTVAAAKKGPSAPAKKRWTFMVYMAGDNNLDQDGVADIGEMKQVGSNDAVNILVQFDRAGKNSQTRRYYLRQGTSMQSDAVQSLGETNCGDPAVLEDFLKWGVGNYPADHYAVVLWNHGAGWDDSNVYAGAALGDAAPPVVRKGAKVRNAASRTRGAVSVRQVHAALARARRVLFSTSILPALKSASGPARAIAFDDQAQDYLDNVEMKAVLNRVRKSIKHKFDIFGMDACLMSMAEVAYQVRGAANIAVGSQETEPDNGWPYDRILKALAAKPEMAPRDFAAVIVNQYLASYGKNEGVTQSATDLAALPELAKAIDALAKTLKSGVADAAVENGVMQARLKVQEYSAPYDDYCDLIDLCDLISASVARPEIAKACDAVKQAAVKAVIDSGAQGDAVAHSHGLSIYFPKRRRSTLYGRLDFAKSTKWDEFIDAYLAQSVHR